MRETDAEFAGAVVVHRVGNGRLLECPCGYRGLTSAGTFRRHRDGCTVYRARELELAQAMVWKGVLLARRARDGVDRAFVRWLLELLRDTDG